MIPDKFDLLNTSLTGNNLIEASAGTGKTYTIAGLYIRILLEKRLSVDKILVVTFTEAATAELKDRIRGRIKETIKAMHEGGSDDPFISEMCRRFSGDKESTDNLKSALRSFDEASIFTIHGFCLRILQENAFESGVLFDTELVHDQREISEETVHDFWRKNFYTADRIFVEYALKKGVNPDSLNRLVRNLISKSRSIVTPRSEFIEYSELQRNYSDSFYRTSQLWKECRKEISDILLNSDALKKNIYNKNLPTWLEMMERYLGAEYPSALLFEKFENFTSHKLKSATKAKCTTPEHLFFDYCQELKDSYDNLDYALQNNLTALKRDLLIYAQNEIGIRKANLNIQGFDDLLFNLESALLREDGDYLSQKIRERYQVALIDEFQDTDPTQYNIFNRIFGTQDNIPLFMIGDPKQAIYGFRGADIFAYLKAARNSDEKFTLTENWRSEKSLIRAVNTIFSKAENPFVFGEIPFYPVGCPEKGEDNLLEEGKDVTPMHIWYMASSEYSSDKKAISKSLSRVRIADSVAAEISRLVRSGRFELGEKTLKESDVAVLVRTNSESHIIKKSLEKLNIPAVIYSGDNLFASSDADDMDFVLKAVAHPKSVTKIKTALSTDIFGLKSDEISAIENEDDNSLEMWLIKFNHYHILWRDSGIVKMLQELIKTENVLERLRKMPGGERKCTNILHLTDVLHSASIERKMGVESLIKWFSKQRDPETQAPEEHQLRLESDENAVRIVTIHKSKGMEYPVVFCPYVWGSAAVNSKNGYLEFHDPDNDMIHTVDIGSEEKEKNTEAAVTENMAENLRLLYVALTRAKYLCYMVWGRFKNSSSSAPAYLFHQGSSGENLLKESGERYKKSDDSTLFSDLNELSEMSGGTINVCEMPSAESLIILTGQNPETEHTEKYRFRKFNGKIENNFKITSFSALVSGKNHILEQADRDETNGKEILPSLSSEGDLSIFNFPKGAKPGTLIHEIFEYYDFADSNPEVLGLLVRDKLKLYGFEEKWTDIICEMVKSVLDAELCGDNNRLKLSGINQNDRINELEFYFPLKKISPGILRNIFSECQLSVNGNLIPEKSLQFHFSPVKGFMKGFIDMVFCHDGKFYLLDWKSNYLGGSPEKYDSEALRTAMSDSGYILQYHIYTLALHQYLENRIEDYDYKKHFGGVFYIFVRGVEKNNYTCNGIYYDKPDEALIRRLADKLIDTSKQ